jgi:hypothetical protein
MSAARIPQGLVRRMQPSMDSQMGRAIAAQNILGKEEQCRSTLTAVSDAAASAHSSAIADKIKQYGMGPGQPDRFSKLEDADFRSKLSAASIAEIGVPVSTSGWKSVGDLPNWAMAQMADGPPETGTRRLTYKLGSNALGKVSACSAVLSLV